MIEARRIAAIDRALGAHGLALRGGFNFEPGEAAPAASLLLAGNVGSRFWRHFAAWRQGTDGPDPLDRWTKEIVGQIAGEFGARALYPSDRPYQPFQRWAMRAEGLRASPLELLIHPRYGLWHAYRAALLFDTPLELGTVEPLGHPCEACIEKPCLRACPVDAHGAAGFDVEACARFQHGTGLRCRTQGCLNRNACPVGADHRYAPEFQAFLAEAFLRAHPA